MAKTEETKSRRERDPEFEALGKMMRILGPFDSDARGRMLDYLVKREAAQAKSEAGE